MSISTYFTVMEEFDKWKRSFHFAFEHVNANVVFLLYRVKGKFCKNFSFSSLNLSLEAYTKDLFQIDIRVKDLFKICPGPENGEQLKFIHTS